MILNNQRQEAYEAEKAQAKRSTITEALGYMVGKYILLPLVKLINAYFLSILWVAFFLFMAGRSIWLGLLAAAVLGAAIYFPLILATTATRSKYCGISTVTTCGLEPSRGCGDDTRTRLIARMYGNPKNEEPYTITSSCEFRKSLTKRK